MKSFLKYFSLYLFAMLVITQSNNSLSASDEADRAAIKKKFPAIYKFLDYNIYKDIDGFEEKTDFIFFDIFKNLINHPKFEFQLQDELKSGYFILKIKDDLYNNITCYFKLKGKKLVIARFDANGKYRSIEKDFLDFTIKHPSKKAGY